MIIHNGTYVFCIISPNPTDIYDHRHLSTSNHRIGRQRFPRPGRRTGGVLREDFDHHHHYYDDDDDDDGHQDDGDDDGGDDDGHHYFVLPISHWTVVVSTTSCAA